MKDPRSGPLLADEEQDYVLLMVDLSHFSEEAADRKPNEIRSLLQHFYDEADACIKSTRSKATIEQCIGDAILIAEEIRGEPKGKVVSRLLKVAESLIKKAKNFPENVQDASWQGALSAKGALAEGHLCRGSVGNKGATLLFGAPLITLFRLEASVRSGCILLSDSLYRDSCDGSLQSHRRTLALRGVKERHFIEIEVAVSIPDERVTRRQMDRAAEAIRRADAQASGMTFFCAGLLALLLFFSLPVGAQSCWRWINLGAHLVLAGAFITGLSVLWPRTNPWKYDADRKKAKKKFVNYYGHVPAELPTFCDQLEEVDSTRLDGDERAQAKVLERIEKAKQCFLKANIFATLFAFLLILSLVFFAPKKLEPGCDGKPPSGSAEGHDKQP